MLILFLEDCIKESKNQMLKQSDNVLGKDLRI
ncbi:uncharacterized protein METZ01_LOCUS400120 [marine metagenome]|uniref:Uncharacterized protein n=1 Tax=marine metagenome TaxID=408172 RepID=A0A382VL51_9ZZZZ